MEGYGPSVFVIRSTAPRHSPRRIASRTSREAASFDRP